MSSRGVGKFCTQLKLFRHLVPTPGFTLELQSLYENRVFAQLLGRHEVREWTWGKGLWGLVYVSKWDTNNWLLFTGSQRSETSKIGAHC